MSRLLVAEQISRAADIEIVARELKPRPEIIQIGQHLEPLFGAFGHQPVGGGGEIGVSACLGAADAATKLVELRPAEAGGRIDEDGKSVGSGKMGWVRVKLGGGRINKKKK